MRVSGEECVRVSQLGPPPDGAAAAAAAAMASNTLATAPARGPLTAGRYESAAPEAAEVRRVVGKVVKEAEVREDVVAELRQRIENGTYNVTGQQIGEMMVRRMLADRVR
jgi:anti-sigma28 factor (negative regulator of flagellin synthesis)